MIVQDLLSKVNPDSIPGGVAIISGNHTICYPTVDLVKPYYRFKGVLSFEFDEFKQLCITIPICTLREEIEDVYSNFFDSNVNIYKDYYLIATAQTFSASTSFQDFDRKFEYFVEKSKLEEKYYESEVKLRITDSDIYIFIE